MTLRQAHRRARETLLAARGRDGAWRGRLSSSALANAVTAFALSRAGGSASHVAAGLRWLAADQHEDGGWGDTPESPPNLSTTTLAWAALTALGGPPEVIARAHGWLARRLGGPVEPAPLARAVADSYGADRTFSAPILALGAEAGVLGPAPACWQLVPALPFELAALPRALFAGLGLPMVSYALPALIAIGQLRHVRSGSRSPLRALARAPTLARLAELQPPDGGFLEATPLTAFVLMSLAGIGRSDDPVARRCVAFLESSMRPDGSWPIDTDLSTWVTSLAVAALGREDLEPRLADRYAALQLADVHPYTGAAPGGWAWTDLPGGVPDADDTAGALLALHKLAPERVEVARRGVIWLLDLQNRDGGFPTFCRGWGTLPFDRSAPDLTAHALRALSAWSVSLPDLARRIDSAIEAAAVYARRSQSPSGAWVPLWFGNQQSAVLDNPVIGTARMIRGICEHSWARQPADAGVRYLVGARHASGGWGGAPGVEPSIEETAMVVEALSQPAVMAPRDVLDAGAQWLAARVLDGGLAHPAPIGLYFANLWYSEALYPAAFATAALRAAISASG